MLVGRAHDQIRVLAERHVAALAVDLGGRKNHDQLVFFGRVLQHDFSAVDVGLDRPHRRFDDQADADRRTFEVDVKLSEIEPHLQPGMTGELAFVVESRERAVVVPSQAVQSGAVYVLEQGRLKRRPVKVGIKSVERTEILDGLASYCSERSTTPKDLIGKAR